MKLKKILCSFIQFILMLLVFFTMYLGGLKFFIASFVFFSLGGLFEFITMKLFVSKAKAKKIYKDTFYEKIKKGSLWVHMNLDFIQRYNSSIYNLNKFGIGAFSTSYIIMLIYVLLALALYTYFNYFGFLVYLIPVLTNLSPLRKYKFQIIQRIKENKK